MNPLETSMGIIPNDLFEFAKNDGDCGFCEGTGDCGFCEGGCNIAEQGEPTGAHSLYMVRSS
jgi:hypothetical protein